MVYSLLRLLKLLAEVIAKFRTLKKSAHLVLMQSLEKAIWNWMDTYPQEFIDLQKNSNEELTKERGIIIIIVMITIMIRMIKMIIMIIMIIIIRMK